MFTASHLRSPARDRTVLIVLLASLAASAWLVLWLWDASPYERYLHHDLPTGLGTPLELGLFVLGWGLMIVAMMLPTVIPLLVTFRALVSRRSRPGVLVGTAILGYLVTWMAFGLVAWVGDRGVHAAVDALPWLAVNSRLVLAGTFFIAGAYQFSALKYRCLDECRSPLGFVMNRWRGVSERREAFGLGVAHGLFCVGCCWSLMLVMFGVGLGSLAWMLTLGAITAVEKNAPWGRLLSRPLGVGLLLAGLMVVNGW
jgi:predicted metal-binding membrane protein